MWPVPDVVKIVFAALARLFQLLVGFSCLSGGIQNLARRCGPCQILIGHASHLMSRPLDATVVSRLQICRGALGIGVCPYAGHTAGCWVQAPKRLQRVDCATEIILSVARVRSRMSKCHGVGMVRLCCSCFSRLRSAWPLLARSVLFGEALLAGLALPVIVAHSPPVLDQPTSKLPEH